MQASSAFFRYLARAQPVVVVTTTANRDHPGARAAPALTSWRGARSAGISPAERLRLLGLAGARAAPNLDFPRGGRPLSQKHTTAVRFGDTPSPLRRGRPIVSTSQPARTAECWFHPHRRRGITSVGRSCRVWPGPYRRVRARVHNSYSSSLPTQLPREPVFTVQPRRLCAGSLKLLESAQRLDD